MKLRHVILIIILGGAAGILCVWHNVRIEIIEYRITSVRGETEKIEQDLPNVNVELENLRQLNNLQNLANDCGITDYLRPPVLPDNS